MKLWKYVFNSLVKTLDSGNVEIWKCGNMSSIAKGAFLLSELAGQTHHFAKKMQPFEETLA